MPGLRTITVTACVGPERTACGKFPHPSKAAAKAVAKRMIAQDRRWPLDLYQCRFCGFWHIGHRHPARVRNAEGPQRP